MSIDPVILELKAQVDGYIADMKKAQRETNDNLDRIEKRGFQMGQSLKKGFDLAKAAAVAFYGSLVYEKVSQAITAGLEYASSLGEVAQQLGVTTDALQEYRYAATQAGLSQDEMDQALAQLTRRAGEAASGTKAQAEAFEKLGISVRTANNEMIPTGDLIPMIADGLQKIESPAQRAAILMDLFGKSGQKLEPLLAGGSAAINNLRNAAYELGIVLSSQQIQNADDTADKLAAVKTVLEANIAGAVANNTGAILALANALGQIVVMAGRAAEAFRRFKLSQGLAQEEAKISSWFTSEKDRAQSIRNANAYRAEIAKMDGTQDKTGGFRDYNAAPIPGFTPGKKGGAAMPAAGVASAGGLGKVKGAGGGVGGGPTGPSAAEIQNRLDGQLASYAQQAISAMQSVATSTEEKADLELRSVELARIRMLAEIKADDHYSKAQKEILTNQVEALAERERERVEFQRKVQKERDANDLADASYRVEADALKAQLDLTDNREERRQLAFDLLDLEYRYQKSLLESVIASETASQAEKERARVALTGLNNSQGAKRTATGREFASPGERYVSDLAREAENINDAFESAAINGLERLNDGLAKSVQNALGLHGVLGDIVGDFIEIALRQAILRPLAEAMFGGSKKSSGGGGGGLLDSIISTIASLPGRAGGGYVAPGQVYRVNEAASPGRVEAFMSRDGGTIIPLGQMNGAVGGSGATVVQHFNLDARGAVMTQDLVNQINSMGQRAAEAGARGGHALAARDMAQMRRPKL